MPGGDGTGPLGWGPQSGRAAGYCTGYPAPGNAHPGPGGSFRGYAYSDPPFYPGAYVEEKTMLKRRAGLIKEQLQFLENRLKEIEDTDPGNMKR